MKKGFGQRRDACISNNYDTSFCDDEYEYIVYFLRHGGIARVIEELQEVG